MPTLNISLPEPLREYVESQVNSGRYNSTSEYIGELIRSDERARSKDHVEELLLAGFESGDTSELDEDEFLEIRREARAEHHSKTGSL